MTTCPDRIRGIDRFALKGRAGLTLIEISLALGIAVVLAAVALPALGGWIGEHKLRSQLGELAEVVMRARLEAEATGESRWISLGEPETAESSGGWTFQVEPGLVLESQGANGKWGGAPDFIRVEGGGVLNPRLYRMVLGERWISFRFDPLTGHLREEEFEL